MLRRQGLALSTLIVSFLFVLSAGCGESVGPVPNGRLSLSWEVSPQGCADSGVGRVQIRLESGERTDTQTYPCEKGQATVDGLRPAQYVVDVAGIDEEGRERYTGGGERVTIQGGDLTEGPHVRLTAKSGGLTVSWRFENGRLCGSMEIGKVELVVYDSDDYQIREKKVECSSGEALLEDLPPGEVLVEVRGEGDETVFAGFDRTEVPIGDTAETSVVLGSTK